MQLFPNECKQRVLETSHQLFSHQNIESTGKKELRCKIPFCSTHDRVLSSIRAGRLSIVFFYLIYKEEIWSACLFPIHLDTLEASAARLGRNPSFVNGKVKVYFFPGNIRSSSLKRPLCISNQWDYRILWRRKSTLQHSMIAPGPSYHRFSRVFNPNLRPIQMKFYVYLRANRHSSPKKPAHLRWIVAQTPFDEVRLVKHERMNRRRRVVERRGKGRAKYMAYHWEEWNAKRTSRFLTAFDPD